MSDVEVAARRLAAALIRREAALLRGKALPHPEHYLSALADELEEDVPHARPEDLVQGVPVPPGRP